MASAALSKRLGEALRPARSGAVRRLACAVLLACAGGCARDELLHGLDERQANEVVVALDEGGLRAEKRRDEGSEGAWRVEVAADRASAARRLLAERELPHPRPPGFGEVFGKGSVVPTATEERALFLHALSGELCRSVEAIDGVAEARVHLAIPAADPMHTGPPMVPRAAVLVKARPGARARLEGTVPGIQALVAGAVIGLEHSAVAVVLSEVTPGRAEGPGRARPYRTALLAFSIALALSSVAVPGVALLWRRPAIRSALLRLRRPRA